MFKSTYQRVGALAGLLLFCTAWLSGFYDQNNIVAWVGVLMLITATWRVIEQQAETDLSARAWSIATWGAGVALVARAVGLIANRWTLGKFLIVPETPYRLFGVGPMDLLRSVLNGNLISTVVLVLTVAFLATLLLMARLYFYEEETVSQKTKSSTVKSTKLPVAYLFEVDKQTDETLKSANILYVDDLLSRGKTAAGRVDIAKKTSLSRDTVLRLINQADLCRISGVNSEMAFLLEAAGVDSPTELAGRTAKNLVRKLERLNDRLQVVSDTPTLDQVDQMVSAAKKLSKVVTH